MVRIAFEGDSASYLVPLLLLQFLGIKTLAVKAP